MISIGLLLLRLTLGLVFILHGAQKLFSAFGGHGLTGSAQFMNTLRLRPAKFWATAAALGEFLGGILLVVGLFTPLAALLIIAVMLVAIMKVHIHKGFWNSQGGYEYNLVLAAIAVVLGLTGAGAYSLDTVFALGMPEPQTFLLGLLALLILLMVALSILPWLEQRRQLWKERLHRPSHA